jgi:hypothetical protein
MAHDVFISGASLSAYGIHGCSRSFEFFDPTGCTSGAAYRARVLVGGERSTRWAAGAAFESDRHRAVAGRLTVRIGDMKDDDCHFSTA